MGLVGELLITESGEGEEGGREGEEGGRERREGGRGGREGEEGGRERREGGRERRDGGEGGRGGENNEGPNERWSTLLVGTNFCKSFVKVKGGGGDLVQNG